MADMKFTSARIVLLLIGTLYMALVVTSSFGQSRIQISSPVTESELRETESHINQLAIQLARLQTTVELSTKAAEQNHTTLLAVSVPVFVLALEGLFRLMAAMILRKQEVPHRKER